MSARFVLEALASGHDRPSFGCGDAALDRYFRTLATQDIRRRVANCFVAAEAPLRRVAGFYTIAAAAIATPDLPTEISARLPRYPTTPAVRIGRLAVDLRYRGQGLGAALLADAARRTFAAAPAAFALIVDAKDEAAAAFYAHHGFIAFPVRTLTLFLPMATAEKAFLLQDSD